MCLLQDMILRKTVFEYHQETRKVILRMVCDNHFGMRRNLHSQNLASVVPLKIKCKISF